MKRYHDVSVGKREPSVAERRINGLWVWIVVLCVIIALCVMNRQDYANQHPSEAQEKAFRQEQARRLAALGIGPVTTEGGPAYADRH